jgi:hypothetical protein
MPTNNAPGVFTPRNELPTEATELEVDNRPIRLELEEALSGGIRVVVDVYIAGR